MVWFAGRFVRPRCGFGELHEEGEALVVALDVGVGFLGVCKGVVER